MGYVGRSLVYQFQRFCLEHESKELLIRFRFKDDGFAIETIIKENFIGCKVKKTFVTKDQAIVDIPDVADEEGMVGKDLMEVDGPDLFADGDDH